MSGGKVELKVEKGSENLLSDVHFYSLGDDDSVLRKGKPDHAILYHVDVGFRGRVEVFRVL